MPFSRTSQYLPTGVAGFRPILSIGAGIATSGMSTAGQIVGAGAGRFIDSMTGNRSPVRKFIKNKMLEEEGAEMLAVFQVFKRQK